MFKLLKIWLMALFLGYSSGAVTTSKQKTLVKHYNFPGKSIVNNFFISEGELDFIYVLCSDHGSRQHCKITLDQLDNTENPPSCEIDIVATDNAIIFVNLLNKTRALVMSIENQKATLTNVNLNDCTETSVVLTLNEGLRQTYDEVEIVPYENSYDAIYPNHQLCQNHPCRITFDNNGTIINDAKAWPVIRFGREFDDLGVHLETIADRSPDKGYIRNHGLVPFHLPNILMYNDEGEKLLVANEKVEDKHAISKVGGNIGICTTSWISFPIFTLKCRKFDYKGKLIKTELYTNTSDFVGDGKRILEGARQNLPEGFIHYTILCPSNIHGSCVGLESYYAYRFNGNGELIKAIKINDFKCQEGSTTLTAPQAFQNKAGQNCVIFMCENHRRTSNLPDKKWSTVGVRCFTDDELL